MPPIRVYATLGTDGLLLPEQAAGFVLEAQIGAPNGVAPLDANGAVPPTVLAPTGTPDGTKFLRDDSSWQPAGGAHPDLATHTGLGLAPTHGHPYEASGAVTAHEALSNPHPAYATDSDLTTHAATPHGGGAWTTVIKTADESKNNLAVVADDALLKFTTLPNTNYVIRLSAFFLTNATADLKYRLVHGGTTTRVRRLVRRTATTDIAQTIVLATAFDAADVILSTTGLNPWLEEDVILQVGASGGLFRLQWAQVTSNAGPTTCLEGSYLEYAIT